MVDNFLTARTCPECAIQRAENLYVLGARKILELCVGPSLQALEKAYQKYDLQIVGNDFEFRWKNFYPQGKWILGDALKLDYIGFDAVVFAPPLSFGCTGRRVDSCSIFLSKIKNYRGIAALVLPGRSLSTSQDRKEYYHLLSQIPYEFEVVPLSFGKRKIVKYYDVYMRCSDERPD